MYDVYFITLVYLAFFGIIDLIFRMAYKGWLSMSLLVIGLGGALTLYDYKTILISFTSAFLLSFIAEKTEVWGRGDTYVVLTLSFLLSCMYIIIMFMALGMIFFQIL